MEKLGYIKPLEKLTLKDDFIFGEVMKEERLLRPLLEKIIEHKIGPIKYYQTQDEIKSSEDSKKVILDLFLEDENKIINVEMQKVNVGDLERRARAYHDETDLRNLSEGISYHQLKDNYVIFICDFDLFGEDYPIYYCQMCRSNKIDFSNLDKILPNHDGVYTFFLNLKTKALILDPELKAFYTYMKNGRATTGYTQELEKKVASLKINKEVKSNYMKYASKMDDYRKLFYQEGKTEGLEQGKAEIIKNLFAKGLDKSQIVQYTGLSLSEIEKIIN